MTTPAHPFGHMCLLSPQERLIALASGNLEHGWLLQADLPQNYSVAGDLQSRNQFLARCALCVVLVLVNANDTLLKSFSQMRGKGMSGQSYSPSSVMFVSNLISVFIGNVLCIVKFGYKETLLDMKRLRELSRFWAGRQLVQMSLPAVCFTLSGTLKFVALGLVPPDVVITLEQSSVLLCALMGWAWLGKRYSVVQVSVLLQITCGFLWYQSAQHRAIGASAQDASQTLSQYWAGLLLMCGSVVMVTAGGVSCEKLVKGATDRPFFIQKAQMELSMAAAGLLYCLVLQPILQGSSPLAQHGLLHGWDRWTVLVLIFHTSKSWLATTTVRTLDNLTFTLAGNVAMLLVYVERLLFLDEDLWESFRLEVLAALMFTALGVGGFAVASVRHQRELRRNKRKKRSCPKEILEPLLRRKSSQDLDRKSKEESVSKRSTDGGSGL